jgi:hypothetical protein
MPGSIARNYFPKVISVPPSRWPERLQMIKDEVLSGEL